MKEKTKEEFKENFVRNYLDIYLEGEKIELTLSDFVRFLIPDLEVEMGQGLDIESRLVKWLIQNRYLEEPRKPDEVYKEKRVRKAYIRALVDTIHGKKSLPKELTIVLGECNLLEVEKEDN